MAALMTKFRSLSSYNLKKKQSRLVGTHSSCVRAYVHFWTVKHIHREVKNMSLLMTLYCLIHIDCTGKTGSLLTHCMNHELKIDLRHCAALESSLETNCCIRAQALLSVLSLLSLTWEVNYCFGFRRLLMFIKLPLLFDLSVKRVRCENDWCKYAALLTQRLQSCQSLI